MGHVIVLRQGTARERLALLRQFLWTRRLRLLFIGLLTAVLCFLVLVVLSRLENDVLSTPFAVGLSLSAGLLTLVAGIGIQIAMNALGIGMKPRTITFATDGVRDDVPGRASAPHTWASIRGVREAPSRLEVTYMVSGPVSPTELIVVIHRDKYPAAAYAELRKLFIDKGKLFEPPAGA
jgi:hypothetical protein